MAEVIVLEEGIVIPRYPGLTDHHVAQIIAAHREKKHLVEWQRMLCLHRIKTNKK